MREGRFISLEGPDGGGKTTQAARLVARLRERGRNVVTVREPGGTELGEWVRRVVQHGATGEPLSATTELLLFSAARRHLTERVIAPALREGRWVVSDRFLDSTTVYQGIAGGLRPEEVAAVHRIAVGEELPDLTLVLDVDPERGLARLHSRAGGGELDEMERRAVDFHRRVREGYRQLAKAEPRRVRLIDASPSAEAVAAAIWKEVAPLVG